MRFRQVFHYLFSVFYRFTWYCAWLPSLLLKPCIFLRQIRSIKAGNRVGHQVHCFDDLALDTAVIGKIEVDDVDAAGVLFKRADRASAFFEAIQLAGFSEDEAHKYFGRPRGVASVTIKPLTTAEAERRFLRKYKNLAAEADLL